MLATGSQGIDGPDQPGVGDGRRLVPAEPAHVLTLMGRRVGLVAAVLQEESDVEMGVPTRSWVHIDMDEDWSTDGVANNQAGFFLGFASRGVGGGLTRVDVPSGLEPQAQGLVQVQHDAASAHDERGARHVDGVRVLVVGMLPVSYTHLTLPTTPYV